MLALGLVSISCRASLRRDRRQIPGIVCRWLSKSWSFLGP